MSEIIHVDKKDGVATVTMVHGTVNAIDERLVTSLRTVLEELETDDSIRCVVLTAKGKFFSFGFDIPHFLKADRKDFRVFIEDFTDLYAYLFMYPKPVLASLNGHCIAGGCMLATACDYRIMVLGKSVISLNELAFGSGLFAGSVTMLRNCVGRRNAQTIVYNAKLYGAADAKALGLVDMISSGGNLAEKTYNKATKLKAKAGPAFAGTKRLLRQKLHEDMVRMEPASIDEFLEIWYHEDTQKNLREIEIDG